nr:uncharacterized protein LOC118879131 isoform X4 [Drosophila suzukii]
MPFESERAYTHPITSVFSISRNPPVLLHFKYCDPSLSSENEQEKVNWCGIIITVSAVVVIFCLFQSSSGKEDLAGHGTELKKSKMHFTRWDMPSLCLISVIPRDHRPLNYTQTITTNLGQDK